MNNKSLVILAVSLLAGLLAANADPVQSSTSVFLTFRHCVSGETVCDSIAPVEAGSYGGLPARSGANAEIFILRILSLIYSIRDLLSLLEQFGCGTATDDKDALRRIP